MSYVEELSVIQNDYGYDLEFSLTDSEGEPVDLTGALSIKVFIAEPGNSVAKVAEDCTVSGDPTGGGCKYTVQEGDFDEAPKDYAAEVEVTYTGKVVTARGLRLKVVHELPETTS